MNYRLNKTLFFITGVISLFIHWPAYANDLKMENDLPTSADAIRPLLVGQKVKDARVFDLKGNPIGLSSTLKKQASLVVFYRGAWCPYCNVHLGELAKLEGELKKLGYQILALSPEKPKYLKETIAKNQLGYTLLSDAKSQAAIAFGLAYTLDEKAKAKMLSYKLDLAERSGTEQFILPVPAAYLMSTTGEVLYSFVSPDYKRRINLDVLLEAAKQYSEGKK